MTDIFGLCESTDKLSDLLNKAGHKVLLIDPYDGIRQSFNNESEAYSAFTENCNQKGYLHITQQAVVQSKAHLIIGFSAGANALWQLIAQDIVSDKQLMCFYPTRIDKFLTLEANALIDVIFPIREASFEVTDIARIIEQKARTKSITTPFEHGFMNSRSLAFTCKAEAFGLELIKNKLNAL